MVYAIKKKKYDKLKAEFSDKESSEGKTRMVSYITNALRGQTPSSLQGLLEQIVQMAMIDRFDDYIVSEYIAQNIGNASYPRIQNQISVLFRRAKEQKSIFGSQNSFNKFASQKLGITETQFENIMVIL